MNFTAIQTLDAPTLPMLRAVPSKQRWQWQELDAIWQDKPAVKIVIVGKAAKAAPKPRQKPAHSPYSSEALPDGGYLWQTPNGALKASFPYDAKADERLRREAKKRIEKRLAKPMGGIW